MVKSLAPSHTVELGWELGQPGSRVGTLNDTLCVLALAGGIECL